jgi:ACS family tartrate transporter-like MFS transporter
MSESIGLSSTVYGLGSGLFFISYALCQLPSNIALDYFGGPIWMAGTVFCWGVVAALFAAVKTPAHFLALRFFLGIFEASAFPGMLFYISIFYPKNRTQMPMTAIIAGILISQCAGAALAAGLLSLDGKGGLAGWQWLFLIEGLACILVAAYWICLMPRSIQHCRYLTQDERNLLDAEMEKQRMSERQHVRGSYGSQIKHALQNPITFVAGFFYFCYFLSYYGLLYFCPLIVQSALGRPPTKNGRPDLVAVGLTAVPFAAAALWQVLFSFHSQRRQEKRWHIVASWTAAAAFMLAMPAAMKAGPAAGMIVLILCTCGIYGAFSVSSSYVMQLLGAERAVGGAIMNSLGNLGGFVGPYVIGSLKDQTGDYFAAMYLMGGGLVIAAATVAIYQPRWSEAKSMPNTEKAAEAIAQGEAEAGLPAPTPPQQPDAAAK